MRRKNPQFYSVEYLIEQIKIFINQKKTRITIADSFLSNKPETISEFIRLAHKENIQLEQINFFAEPGYVNRHIFRELSRFPAKKIAIDYGIETGSQKVAMNMQRFSDYDTISKDIIELGKVGVSATAWWLFNLPGESLEDIKLTLDFMKFTINNNVYVERVSPLILFPNTNPYKNKEKYGIRPLMNNFDEFMIFSKIDRNESGIYPELITNESDLLNKKTMLQVQQNIFNIVNDLQKGKPIQLSANNIF